MFNLLQRLAQFGQPIVFVLCHQTNTPSQCFRPGPRNGCVNHRIEHLTLIESVRQDPRRKLTIFEQRYIVRRGSRRSEHPFQLTFRTLPIKGMTRRLERAGFAIEAVLGDYRGRPWDARADVWLILARRI